MKAKDIAIPKKQSGPRHPHTFGKIVASAALALGMVNAADAATVTLPIDETVSSQGWSLQLSEGSSLFSYSTTFVAALNANGVHVSSISPAALQVDRRVNGKYNSIAATNPMSAVTADLNGGDLTVTQVSTQGGVLYTAESDGWDFWSFAITDLQVDLTARRVYADLEGEDIGSMNDVYLWDIGTITGPTTFTLQNGVNTLGTELSGLTITAEAFELVATALGATNVGRSALAAVTDFGTIQLTMSIGPGPLTPPPVPDVPEPATAGLLLAGLATAWSMRSRRRPALQSLSRAPA